MIYGLEAGVILLVAPWTRFWERNYFVEAGPLVEALLTSPFTRGGVSGLGVLSLCVAVAELGTLIRQWRWRRRPGHPRSSPPPNEVAAPELREEACPPS